ncbi:proteasome subunit, putative [Theileria equi strain WA]|uniref:Proteasome subunit beta n=1 Tax=Theileria equi strain WA TaxID=1537102 RepID=L1LBH1_THEEQ|nr:proteasome subunit, putative [Theileria equi strain WA]EKX72757.1 proteasome subunit, putative [Theileria equi strain WA]|eukprot:XP_004832209.1 proteasome subunit, putative [Theileria equi strain WA]
MSGYVTGSAIVGIKYRDGVLLAADTKLSYGRMSRVTNYERLEQVSPTSVFCSSGDAADHQYISKFLKKAVHNELLANNNDLSKVSMDAKMLHNYMARVFYARRSKLDPIVSAAVIAGISDGEPFLGYSDYYGTKYTDDFITTGFGKYFAIGPLREEHRADMSKEEATDLAIRCMRLLYLRDCTASNKIQIAHVTKDGVVIQEPFFFDSKWHFEKFVKPTSALPIAGTQF